MQAKYLGYSSSVVYLHQVWRTKVLDKCPCSRLSRRIFRSRVRGSLGRNSVLKMGDVIVRLLANSAGYNISTSRVLISDTP